MGRDGKGRSCRYIKAIPARARYNAEHRLEDFRLNASRERFDRAVVLIGLSEAAPDAVANASVASAKQDCFAQSSITSEICRLSCSGALPQGI
jgi:hypothetical protein